MEIEQRTAENTAIVLIDYVTGFANLVRSQSVAENVAGARALAQIALTYGVPLVVSTGPRNDPRGGLYPELSEVLGDHEIIHRGGTFDAFGHEGFADAVAATRRRHLLIGGLMTDGCVLHSSLGARRRDYGVSIVVDACGAQNDVTQAVAIHRLTAVGVALTTWQSLAAEMQVSYEDGATVEAFRAIQRNNPGYAKMQDTVAHSLSLSMPLVRS